MTTMTDNSDDIDVAKHEGDIRIYKVSDTNIWIQSDVSVDEVLDDTDSDPTYDAKSSNDTATNPGGDDDE